MLENYNLQSGGVSGNEYHIRVTSRLVMGDAGSNPVLTPKYLQSKYDSEMIIYMKLINNKL